LGEGGVETGVTEREREMEGEEHCSRGIPGFFFRALDIYIYMYIYHIPGARQWLDVVFLFEGKMGICLAWLDVCRAGLQDDRGSTTIRQEGFPRGDAILVMEAGWAHARCRVS
jgi:hypothetical protein